jgi:hypothetical protein
MVNKSYSIKTENKAIEMFNVALKQCIMLGLEVTKENAKELCFTQILFLKGSWYDIGQIDNLHLSNFKDSIEFFNEVKQIIQKL